MSLQLSHRPLSALLPYAANARTHSEAQIAEIAASIEAFGFNDPVGVDAETGIVEGHGRTLALKSLFAAGKTVANATPEAVPVLELSHLTSEQKRAYILAHNRIALNSGWDTGLLAAELKALRDADLDIGLLGFSADELETLLAPEIEKTAGLTDPDDAPPVQERAITRPGDIWVMGKHRLMCGDSTRIDDVERLMDGELADLWLTDPPYNVAYEGKTKDALKIDNDDMADGEFRQFLRDAFTAAVAVMKPGAVFYIWHADSEGYNFRGACVDSGLQVRQCLIWAKSAFVMGRQDYHWKHEPCLYGWKDGAAHLWAADRKQTTILEFDRPARNGEHPTMKPVALFEYQLLNNTNGADIVLDTFGGSGTTAIAAEKNGRHARLMELDPRYCDVIVRRWQDFTGQQATLDGAGSATFAEVESTQ